MSALADQPLQPSMRRMRQFAVRPDRELGQNFLVDSNILGVIGRAAGLSEADVVLDQKNEGHGKSPLAQDEKFHTHRRSNDHRCICHCSQLSKLPPLYRACFFKSLRMNATAAVLSRRAAIAGPAPRPRYRPRAREISACHL